MNYDKPSNIEGLLYLILVHGLDNNNPWSVLAVPISAAMINPNIASHLFVLSIPMNEQMTNLWPTKSKISWTSWNSITMQTMVNALSSQLPQLSLSTGMQWQWVDQALYCQNLVFNRYIFSSHFKKNYVVFLKIGKYFISVSL